MIPASIVLMKLLLLMSKYLINSRRNAHGDIWDASSALVWIGGMVTAALKQQPLCLPACSLNMRNVLKENA